MRRLRSIWILLLILAAAVALVVGRGGTEPDKQDDESSNKLEKGGGATYERQEKGFFPDDEVEEEEDDDEDQVREKRQARKLSMLYKDPDMGIDEKMENFTYGVTPTSVFIIRLQEKYEYKTCEGFLGLIRGSGFFDYDVSLIDPNVTQHFIDRQILARRIESTMPNRYRLHQEPCNHQNEWEFWYEMFQVSENDSTPFAAQDGTELENPNTHLKMLQNWNDVWIKHMDKGVCNQKLLLECLPDFDFVQANIVQGQFHCQCRRTAIGLGTIFDVNQIPPLADSYTTQYYYDNVNISSGEAVWAEEPVRNTLKCALVATMPFVRSEISIINPCDFFLPMIGMCTSECVANATCESVTAEVKQETREKSQEKDPVKRVREHRIHAVYHHLCKCEEGLHCGNINNIDGGGQRMGGSLGLLQVILQVGLSIFLYIF